MHKVRKRGALCDLCSVYAKLREPLGAASSTAKRKRCTSEQRHRRWFWDQCPQRWWPGKRRRAVVAGQHVEVQRVDLAVVIEITGFPDPCDAAEICSQRGEISGRDLSV